MGRGRSVKARLLAKGFQDPDLLEGIVDTSGRVGIRPPSSSSDLAARNTDMEALESGDQECVFANR